MAVPSASKDGERGVMPMDQDNPNHSASQQDKEVLDILLESDLYLELPLRERQRLFKYIVSAYLYSPPDHSGGC